MLQTVGKSRLSIRYFASRGFLTSEVVGAAVVGEVAEKVGTIVSVPVLVLPPRKGGVLVVLPPTTAVLGSALVPASALVGDVDVWIDAIASSISSK
jgi:hypothetical protein